MAVAHIRGDATLSPAPLSGRERLSRLVLRRPDAAPFSERSFRPPVAAMRPLTPHVGTIPAASATRAAASSSSGWSAVVDWIIQTWDLTVSTYDRTHGFLFIFGLVAGTSIALAALPEGQDLVTTVAEDGREQAFWLALSMLWLGLQAWFWMRRIVELEYGTDRDIWGPAKRFLIVAPRVTGGVPLLVVTLTFLRDRFFGGMSDVEMPRGPPLVEALLVVFTAGYCAFVVLRERWHALSEVTARSPWWLWPAFAASVSTVLLVDFTLFPVTWARSLGPAAIVFLGVASILPAMTVAIQLGAAARFPLVGALLVAAAVFPLWTDGQHAVGLRLSGPPPTFGEKLTDDRPSLDAALTAWTAAQGGKPKVLVVVAAEGGASRAGVWTAVALERLSAVTGGALARRTFAVSSISGGSVGAVGWAASLRVPGCAPAPQPGLTHDQASLAATCLDRFVNADALSPSLAAMLFPDLIQRFLPLPILPDRARAIELSWEQAWSASFRGAAGAPNLAGPYRRLLRGGGTPSWTPFVVVGGASEETGRRILTSPVRLDAAFADPVKVRDAYRDYGRDLAASTAILNGARLPWVSPAGRLAGRHGVEHVVDGGYFDGSGVQDARAILAWVETQKLKRHELANLRTVLVTIRYRDSLRRARPPGGWSLANDVVAPFVGGASSRGALQEHSEDPAAAGGPQELQVQLVGMPCEGLPLNWLISRKARRYAESLGSDAETFDATRTTTLKAIDDAALAVLDGDPQPATPPLIRDHFKCVGGPHT